MLFRFRAFLLILLVGVSWVPAPRADDVFPARVLLYQPPPWQPHDEWLSLFDRHAGFKLTVLLPGDVTSPPVSAEQKERMKALVQEGRLEIVLTLADQPILPLLAELESRGVAYRWPADVAAHLARALGLYRRQWLSSPQGLGTPFQALSPAVLDVLKRFRFVWVLGAMDPNGTIVEKNGVHVVQPSLTTGPGFFSALPTDKVCFIHGPTMEETALRGFLDALVTDKAPVRWLTVAGYVTELRQADVPLKGVFQQIDTSPWSKTPGQLAAWAALADARRALETCKNSGRANLAQVDDLMNLLLKAQNGGWWLEWGNQGAPASQKEFISRLVDIYHRCDLPTPEGLSDLFSKNNMPFLPFENADASGPFFEASAQSFRWNDPTSEKHLSRGQPDLRAVTMAWSDEQVVWTVASSYDVNVSSPPMMDVYIDINRLPQVGGVEPLPQRPLFRLDRDAAWEYAVTVRSGTAFLYQYIPRSAPRLVQKVAVVQTGTDVVVSFPRHVLRGNPAQWRLSVVLLTDKSSGPEEDPGPSFDVDALSPLRSGPSPSLDGPFVIPYVESKS